MVPDEGYSPIHNLNLKTGPMTLAPQIPRGPFLYSFYLFFFFYHYTKSIVTENSLSRQRIPVVCQPPVVTILVSHVVLVVCPLKALSPRTQALSCQLYRDPAVSCRDRISMSRPKLGRNLEYLAATWKPHPMTKLYRDMKFSIATMSLTTTTKPCRNIKPYVMT